MQVTMQIRVPCWFLWRAESLRKSCTRTKCDDVVALAYSICESDVYMQNEGRGGGRGGRGARGGRGGRGQERGQGRGPHRPRKTAEDDDNKQQLEAYSGAGAGSRFSKYRLTLEEIEKDPLTLLAKKTWSMKEGEKRPDFDPEVVKKIYYDELAPKVRDACCFIAAPKNACFLVRHYAIESAATQAQLFFQEDVF